MNIKKWTTIAVVGIVAAAGSAVAQVDPMTEIDDALHGGSLKGSLGVIYTDMNTNDVADVNWNAVIDRDAGAGFYQVEYLTDAYMGLQLGIDILAVGEFYENELDLGYTSNNGPDASLRQAYAKYSFGNEDTYILFGRHVPVAPELLDAEYARGLALSFGQRFPDMGFRLSASMLDRYNSSIRWDEEGIVPWVDMDETGGANNLYALTADVELAAGMLRVKPYALFQSEFAAAYGLQAGADYEVEGAAVSFVADYYVVSNDDDNAVNANDANAYRVYFSGASQQGYSAGMGYYAYSDEPNQLFTGNWLNELPSMDDTLTNLGGADVVDDFVGLGSETVWFDFGYTFRPLSFAFQYGNYNDDRRYDYDQWMVKLSYALSQAFEVTLKGVYGKSSNNHERPAGVPAGQDEEFDAYVYQIYGVYTF